MNSNLIYSPIGNQFHPMIYAIMVMLSIPFWATGGYIIATLIVVLAVAIAWKDKVVKVDIAQQKYKEGWFNSWRDLNPEGYLSVFPERESHVMRSRVSEGAFTTSSGYVNFINGRNKIHLHKAKSKEDAVEKALLFNEKWNCGVYDGMDRKWLK